MDTRRSRLCPRRDAPSTLFMAIGNAQEQADETTGNFLVALILFWVRSRPPRARRRGRARLAIRPARRGPLDFPGLLTEVTEEAGLAGVVGFRLSVADLNGDDYRPFRPPPAGRGDGGRPEQQLLYLSTPGVQPAPGPTWTSPRSPGSGQPEGTADGRHSDSAIFADVDNDGDLDIFTLVYVHENYTLDEGTTTCCSTTARPTSSWRRTPPSTPSRSTTPPGRCSSTTTTTATSTCSSATGT